MPPNSYLWEDRVETEGADDGEEGVWEKEACLWGPGARGLGESSSGGSGLPREGSGKKSRMGDWSVQLFTPPAASGSSVLGTLLSPGEGQTQALAMLFTSWVPGQAPTQQGRREMLPGKEQPRHR